MRDTQGDRGGGMAAVTTMRADIQHKWRGNHFCSIMLVSSIRSAKKTPPR